MADWPTDRPSDRSSARPGAQPPVRSEAEARERDIRRFQGLQMLLERVNGGRVEDVAEKYRVSVRVAEERMTEAWKEGVLKELEGQLFEELGPMAMAVYEAQLKLGNLDAARDILGTIGLIKRPGQTVKVQPIPPQQPTVNSIDDYRLARQNRRYPGPPDIPVQPRRGQRLITPPGGSDVPQ